MTKEKTNKQPKNKSKHIANISLGVMGAGFLATLPFEPTTTVKIIQGGFEAGLVGGLADWFAVTALFRHPLNIPIPHTALLPKNRDKITNAILNVVETEWLNKKSIVEKVGKVNITNIVFSKLEEELQKETSKVHIKNALNIGINYIDKGKIEEIFRKSLGEVAQKVDIKHVLSLAIDKSIEHKYDEKVYNVIFNLIEKKVSDKETKEKITSFVLKTMEKKAESSFFKLALKPLVSVGKDKLSTTIEKAIDDILVDLKDENSENRKSILSYIQKELNNVKSNDEIIKQLESKRTEFINGEQFDKVNSHIVELVFNKIHSFVEDDEFIESKVVSFIQNVVSKIKNDEALVEKIENGIKNTLVQFVEQNHSKIGSLVRDNIDKLKNEELIDMMENKIGKELSWIRVNGSLCGFIIGVGLSVLKIFS